jgi:hypothetical protein
MKKTALAAIALIALVSSGAFAANNVTPALPPANNKLALTPTATNNATAHHQAINQQSADRSKSGEFAAA